MAVPLEVQNATDIAKQYLDDSDLDEGYKNTLVDLIETSTIATNGVTQEKKIQMMTQCIHKLAISQVGLIKSIKQSIIDAIEVSNRGIDQRIAKVVLEANTKQCQGCKAMSHALSVEKEEERQKIIDDFVRNSGIKLPKGTTAKDLVVSDGKVQLVEEVNKPKARITKETLLERGIEILKLPYIWIFGCILVFSPYGLEIIKILVQYFGKGGH